MNALLVWVATAWTLGGAVLLFQEAGSCVWWDVVWVLLLALTAYSGLVGTGGLGRARMCAAAVLVVFSAMVVLTVLTGWPFGPVRFQGPATLRLGNVLPLLPPMLAFALLTLAQRTAAVAFPGLGVNALASTTAAIFTVTALNGLTFLGKARLWWLWNPWGEASALWPTVTGCVSLALAGFFLARIYPEDTGLKLTRWSPAAALLLVMNGLFLAAALRFRWGI